ncbi:MAG: hypothetical protein OXG27_01090 [Chloroflexi bacterium]|nr:hypothetical protein [Chloroflexota bacterium]
MRRRLLLLTALTCAVAIAVLLRSATSDVEPVAADDQAGFEGSLVSEAALDSCTIGTESAPSLATYEAAQLFPPTPANSVDLAVSFQADERSLALFPELDFRPPGSPVDSSRDTIRPPPSPRIS